MGVIFSQIVVISLLIIDNVFMANTEEFIFPKIEQKSAVINFNTPALEVVSSDLENDSTSLIRYAICYVIAYWVLIKKIFVRKPKFNSMFFDGFSPICNEIKKNAYSWEALEVIYNLPRYGKGEKIEDRLANYWNGLANAKAVRNRFRITKKLLNEEILYQLKTKNKVKILSIASGSARAVAETIFELVSSGEIKKESISCTLLDLDPTAINYAEKLWEEMKLSEIMNSVNDSTTNLETHFKNETFDIVEMVGFLEYRPHNKAISLLKKLLNLLTKDGAIVVSQIAPNPEKMFMKYVMNWPMVYRTKKSFLKVLKLSGIKIEGDDTRLIYEPQRIHGIALGRK